MKKNISINISGIIFHIEEDGFETLKKYLDSINTYFSTYEDSEEIIADIEGRIAEIFLEKLTDGKQVVSAEDVDLLIRTMGSIADFEALEEEVDFQSPASAESTTSNETEEEKAEPQAEKAEAGSQESDSSSESGSRRSTYVRPDKWYRDLNRKVLGGVASGIAHYYNFDPLWLRVGLLVLFFGNASLTASGLIFAAPLSGICFIGYFILWAILPGNENLEEDQKLKKLYRDPDDRVFGGVSAGLAKYFNADIMVVRIIFIVLFFGFGTGLIAYVILWIITPTANTITDRMQMKGEPVTLSNIDENIKKRKEEEDFGPKGEGAFTTILLFPFRLVGKIFSGISKALSPLMMFLVDIVRIFTGSIISIVGLSVMFAMLVTTGVFLGLYQGDWYYADDWSYVPYEIIQDTIPGIGIAFLLIAIFVPFLYVFIAGITIIAKRRVMSSSVGWSIFGIWLIAFVGAGITLPNVIRDFREEGRYTQTDNFQVNADTVLLKLNDNYVRRSRFDRGRDYDDRFLFNSEFTDLDIRSTDDTEFRLEKRFISRGRTIRDAEANAQEVDYRYEIDQNSITFDAEIGFERGAKFRAQEVDLTLYIPKNRPFKLDRGMRRILHYFPRGYSWWEVYRNTWIYDDRGLRCIDCGESSRTGRAREYNNDDYSKSLDLDPFTQIRIDEGMEVVIEIGEEHKIRFEAWDRDIVDELDADIFDDELSISSRSSSRDLERVKVYITMESLKEIKGRREAKIEVTGANGSELNIELSDDSSLQLDGSYDELNFELQEKASLSLSGSFDKMEGSISGSGKIYAYDAISKNTTITTYNESRARINVTDFLKVDARGFSTVRYKGDPQLDVVNEGRSANISRY